jgi:hypothetical protein
MPKITLQQVKKTKPYIKKEKQDCLKLKLRLALQIEKKIATTLNLQAMALAQKLNHRGM